MYNAPLAFGAIQSASMTKILGFARLYPLFPHTRAQNADLHNNVHLAMTDTSSVQNKHDLGALDSLLPSFSHVTRL